MHSGMLQRYLHVFGLLVHTKWMRCLRCAAICSIQTFRFLLLFRRYYLQLQASSSSVVHFLCSVRCQGQPPLHAWQCMVHVGCRASPDFAWWFAHKEVVLYICVVLCFGLFYKMLRLGGWAICAAFAMSLSCVACEMKHCLFTVVSAIRHVIVSEQVKH